MGPFHTFLDDAGQHEVIHKDSSQDNMELINLKHQIERFEELLGGVQKEPSPIVTLQKYQNVDLMPSDFIMYEYAKPQNDQPIYKLSSLEYATEIDKFNFKLPQLPNFQCELNALLDYLNQENVVKNLQMFQQTQLINQQLDHMQQNIDKINIQLKQLTRDLNSSANSSENITPMLSSKQLI